MNCKICGEVIKGKRADALYCSDKCRNKAETIRVRKMKLANRVIPSRNCLVCGKEFTPNIMAIAHQLYCSKKCCSKACNARAAEEGRKAASAKLSRQRHKEEILLRDKKYKNQIRFNGLRDKILERDNYMCIKCGKTSGLIVHHKDETGVSTTQNITLTNNSPDNLITLCRSCHAKIHKISPPLYKNISKERVIEALDSTETVQQAANYLNITRKTLLNKRKRYNLLAEDTE